jgi:hypothetical protein
MVKVITFFCLFFASVLASDKLSLEKYVSSDALENNCLNCHRAQQIPDSLIYRRYLLKYSTDDRIQKVLFAYLKDPKKINSIMPAPFFLKFPMKEKMTLEDEILQKNIVNYVQKYNIKNKLILEK